MKEAKVWVGLLKLLGRAYEDGTLAFVVFIASEIEAVLLGGFGLVY